MDAGSASILGVELEWDGVFSDGFAASTFKCGGFKIRDSASGMNFACSVLECDGWSSKKY